MYLSNGSKNSINPLPNPSPALMIIAPGEFGSREAYIDKSILSFEILELSYLDTIQK